MPDVLQLFAFLGRDPVLAYTLIAAILLAVVALSAGLSRLDFLAVMRLPGILHLLAAVAFGFLLMLLVNTLALGEIGESGASWSMLSGLRRFPLYVFALAYGPSAGLLAAGLFAAFETAGSLPGWREAIFALELSVLGWLAIYPSPRQQRWAGPFNALLAYLLAWSTAGLAFLQWQEGEVSLSGLWAQHQTVAGGVLLSAMLLFFLSPRFYSDFFTHTRIAHQTQSSKGRAGKVVIHDLTRDDPRKHASLAGPQLPELSRQRRRKRSLDKPPDFDV